MSQPLLDARGLSVRYPAPRGGSVRAVDCVDLQIYPGETVGLVGESGCGKSSLGRALLRLEPLAGGSLSAFGADLTHAGKKALMPLRRRSAMIFQDPRASLNPRMTIGRAIEEPLRIHRIGTAASRVAAVHGLLERVGLPPERADQLPSTLSGGQLQRVAIARALALNPEVVVADEAVSALDVSVQAGIINLLLDLQQERGLSYLFVAHDLKVVELISDRVVVMYLGRIVETGSAKQIFEAPRHPYTQALVASAPVADPRVKLRPPVLSGELPSPINPPDGCTFHPRCPSAQPSCQAQRPAWVSLEEGRGLACPF